MYDESVDVDKVLVPDGFFPKHVEAPSPAEAGTSTALVPSDVDPVLSVETLKTQLRTLTRQLLAVADVGEAKRLNIEIQRRRVALILTQETSGIEADGDYHKEMTLLNRMLQGEDMPDGQPQTEVERTEAANAAEALLAKRGVDPLAAARILHVLDALISRTDPTWTQKTSTPS